MKLKHLICTVLIIATILSCSVVSIAEDAIAEVDGASLSKVYQIGEYSGYSAYSKLLSALSYPKATNLDYSIRHGLSMLSYLGILSGGDIDLSKFLTNSEALSLLYKISNREADYKSASLQIQNLRMNYRLNDIDKWADTYYMMALDDGLITKAQFDDGFIPNKTPNASFSKTAYITKQAFLVYLAKLFYIAPSKEIYNLKFYTDFGTIEKGDKPYIDSLLAEEIVFDTPAKRLAPNANVSYRDFLYILTRLDTQFQKNNGLTKNVATVTDIIHDGENINFKFSIDALSYDYIKTDKALKFPCISADAILPSDEIIIGDKVIYYTNPQNQVVFCEIINRGNPNTQNSFKATAVIKGNAFLYDKYSSSLILSDAMRYFYGKWVPASEQNQEFFKIPISASAKIFADGNEIAPDEINTSILGSSVTLTCGSFACSPIFEIIRIDA